MGDGMLSLSWNNHKATFCHILANLRDKERYTDVTLACEGKFYRVHKLVLSTCSEYFEVMFENTPCKHPVIVLNHIKHDEVEALLSYMYAGVVNVAQNDLARLIKAAELLKIKGLAVPDEPPQEAEARKSQPSSWNSRDDRISPLPKRRRRDDSGTPHGGSVASNSPASSPRASPYTESIDYLDKSRTHCEGQSSERRGERTDYRSDLLSNRVDENSLRKEQRGSSQDASGQNDILDETLVKEEVLDTADDRSSDILDSGMDYGGVGDPLDTSNDGSNTGLPNKYDPSQGMPSQSQMGEPVVEALAGPSGMQGWLGDMGGGFSSVENFRGEGSQQDLRQALPGQQPQQMVGLQSYGQTVRRDEQSTSGMNYGPAAKTVPVSGDKLHNCSYCNYSTPTLGHYKVHLRKHTGEKPYFCNMCSYQCAQRTTLMNHIRTHTGERPFACTHCPQRFIQLSNLKYHVVRNHKNGNS